MKVDERIAELRKLMEENNIDIYIVPTADFHQSEYVGEHFKARMFITGFTGSAGTAVITRDQAGLWTDGRYFIQAEKQLADNSVELFRMGEPGVPTIVEFIKDKLPEKGVLGFDGRVVSVSEGQAYENIIKEKDASIKYNVDLIDEIWTDRPPLSKEPAFKLDLKYAGESTESKVKRIREKMQEHGANKHVVCSLDDIMWMLNIRGNDIEFFPLVLSYAIVTMDEVHIYLDESKLNDDIINTLKENGVEHIHPYNQVYEDVKNFDADDVVLIDPGKTNYALYNNIPESCKKVEAANPAILMKAIKNNTEIENIRVAQLKDSIAHVKFMYWLKHNVGKEKITEISASDKLDEFRKEQGNYIRPSFEPISSFGENAAIVHYSPTPETDKELELNNLFLTDTGAGFYEGSTDITRTYVLGEVPQHMKDDFTLVAISNLRLSNAKFLHGSNGMTLDIIARQPFWERNLNFNHGTGHGMGYLMNIHEDPIGFRWVYREEESHQFEEGMVITNEPGIYREGSHGVRLENELLISNGEKNEYGQFMYFEVITFIPFDLDAINPDMMTEQEKKWLNDYHKEVYEKVSPHLTDEEREWLKEYTREI